MKALTIWQPWASLIIGGAKPYEFRSWPAPRWIVGQRIVIHAGSRPIRQSEVTDLQQRLADPEMAWTTGLHADRAEGILRRAWLQSTPRGRQSDFFDGVGSPYEPLPIAAGLGIVTVGPPIDGWDACETFGHRVNDSDRQEHANFAWPMLDIAPFAEPIPCKGAQGFWTWPDAEAAARDFP